MLKTNTKKARANVRHYIRTASADYVGERFGVETESLTDNEFTALVGLIFCEEYGHELKRAEARHNFRPQSAVFASWGSGLACGGLFDYYYNVSAVKVLGDILEETEEERNRYTEAEAESLLTSLIFEEVRKGYTAVSGSYSFQAI